MVDQGFIGRVDKRALHRELILIQPVKKNLGLHQTSDRGEPMILKTILYMVAGYVIICTLVFMAQRKMLYMPAKFQLPPEQAKQNGLAYWPQFESFKGFVSVEPPETVLGTVIVFHGNAGAAYDRIFYMQALQKRNLRVILAEYPGYGGRAGSPSEASLVSDALDIIRLADQTFGGPLFLWGESLGCGVAAAALAKTDVPVKGVVMFLPWDSLPEVAQNHYWYLPAKWLVKDQYNSIENLKTYNGNKAVLLAGKDEVIPVRHGQRLYESLQGIKRLWVFENATHNIVPVSPDLPWWDEVTAFVSQ